MHFAGRITLILVALVACGGAESGGRTPPGPIPLAPVAAERSVDVPGPGPALGPAPLVLAAAGLRVELPADWRIAAGDDPWFARAAAPAGELRCIIEWWPAGLVPNGEHRELPLGDRPGRLFASSRGASIRVLERDGAILACSWGREDTGSEALVDGIVGSLRAVTRPARPERAEGRYRRICGYLGYSPGGEQRRVLALDRDGAAWLGDPSSGALRRIDGEGYHTIVCHEDRGLLLTREGAVMRIGLDMPGPRITAEPSGIADDGKVVALASQFLIRADGRLVHWNYQTEGQALAMRLPGPIAAAWGSGTNGCVLTPAGQLWCWGSEDERQDMPPVRFTGAGELVDDHTGASAFPPQSFEFTSLVPGQIAQDPVLERHGESMCLKSREEWFCIDRFGGQRRFPSCSAQPCRCIAPGQCSDSPLANVAVSFNAPRRRLDDVVLGGPGFCVERRDGALACRTRDTEMMLYPEPPKPADSSG